MGQRIRYIPLFLLVGCAYFNTYYNAQSFYKKAMNLKKTSPAQARDCFGKAKEGAIKVLKRYPNSRWADDALFLLAMCSYYREEYREAIRYYDHFIAAFPESKRVKEARFYKALSLRALKEYPSALEAFSSLKDEEGWRERVLLEIAETYYQTKDYEETTRILGEFLEEYPKGRRVQEVLLKRANAYFELGQWERATKDYKAYIAHAYTSEEKAEAKLKLSECLMKMGKPGEAVSQLKSIEGNYPALEPKRSLLLGKALLKLGKREEAIKAFQGLGGKEGAEAYFIIGRLYEEKDPEKAIFYYDSTKLKDPSSDFAIMALKRSSFLQELIKPQPDSTKEDPAKVQFLLAEQYLLNLKEPEEALKEYRKVFKLYPDSPYAPKALYAQIYILKEVLKKGGYEDIYKRLLEKYPSSLPAQKAKELIGGESKPGREEKAG